MCETCDEAKAVLTEVTAPLYATFVRLVSEQLPRARYENFNAYHFLIGSTPDPKVQVDLDIPDIRNFIDSFRATYLQEV